MPITDRYLRLGPWALRIERQQAIDEGRTFDRIESTFDSVLAEARDGADVSDAARGVLDRIRTLPTRDGYPYVEPSSLSTIREERPVEPHAVTVPESAEQLADRLHAAWQGRCAGCLLGKPIETIPATTVWSLLEAIDAFPLSGYLPADLPAAQRHAAGLADIPSHNRTYADAVDHMPRDDDLDYTILGLSMIRANGPEFTSSDVANQWLSTMPAFDTYTAERVAYRNFLDLVEPPASARHRNPFREWIGAQIRADIYGYLSVGDPTLAAELAWRDARISHVKNGIYGAMWVAAMIAAAPGTDDPGELVEIGLSEIPTECRLSEAIETVVRWFDNDVDWLTVVDRLHDRWDEDNDHHWLHTISNAQIVAMGLLWSDGDFGQAITRTVHAGLDTDCTGATVGSIMGMFLGTDAIDERWTEPLGDEIETALSTRPRARISTLAAETWEAYRSVQADVGER